VAGLRPHVLSSRNFSRIGYYTSLSTGTSTESALVVDGDIERATYERKCAVSLALDISAASDAVDHITLCRRADCEFGKRNIALRWLQFLSPTDRSILQLGWILEQSATTTLSSGDPQCSIPVPLLFAMYVSPTDDIVRVHRMQYHQYADV